MIDSSIGRQRIVVVGNHFFYKNKITHRINSINLARCKEIEALFVKNGQEVENWEELAKDPDPIIRSLVVRNHRALHTLSMDSDPDISRYAQEIMRMFSKRRTVAY
jgi:hypothetical protein